MENEQCGFCWNLKFDNKGKETHGIIYNHSFTPLDFCLDCGKPQFDQHGFLTHTEINSKSFVPQGSNNSHSFHSKNNENLLHMRKKRTVMLSFFTLGGALSIIIGMTFVSF